MMADFWAETYIFIWRIPSLERCYYHRSRWIKRRPFQICPWCAESSEKMENLKEGR